MFIKKADVKRLTQYMDRMATAVQSNPAQYGMTAAQGYEIALSLDQSSDRLERMVGRDADVVEHEKDEDYMSTFDDAGPVDNQMDSDEPYMDHFRDDTFDQLIDHPELTPGNSTPGGEDSSNEVDSSDNWWEMDASDADTDWRNW
jgi:hypothetical protein